MAAVSITGIELGDDAVIEFVRFALAVSLGDAVYLDSDASNRWKPADANDTIVTAGRDGIGIALHAVSATDNYGVIVRSGTVFLTTLGASAEGTTFIIGDTPGAIHPISDAASGWFATVLGVGGTEGGTGIDEFIMQPIISDHAKA